MKARVRHALPPWVTMFAIVLLLAGLTLELSLAHETLDARATLRHAVARASPIPADVGHDDADVLAAVRTALSNHEHDAPAALLAARAEAVQTPDARHLASLAAASAGSFGEAARQAELAARLAPGDAAARSAAEDAMDTALLARVRTPARIAGGTSILVLLLAAVRGARRRRRRRQLEQWLDGVEGRMSVSVDGRRDPTSPTVAPDTRAITVDVFLRAKRPRRPASTGPTMALVLSHAASSTTLRLTPVRDVRGDAVRTRLKDATLTRVLARPGTWRLEARLDGRAIAERRMEVEAKPARRGGRLLHLVGRA